MEEEKFFLEKDRIPVFIGVAGSKKRELEKKFNCKLNINSNSGEVNVFCDDAVAVFVISNIIAAVNYGHSPEHAMKLEDENYVLDVIDLKQMVKDHERLKSVAGRIIGKDGSTRRAIEEITKCNISIKDSFVSSIGPYENIQLIHEALEMLIKGSSHKSFYSYLERNKSSQASGLL